MDKLGKQVQIIKHTIGMDERDRNIWGYRNYFATTEHTHDDIIIKELVTYGYMKLNGEQNGMQYYSVTKKGAELVGLQKTKIRKLGYKD